MIDWAVDVEEKFSGYDEDTRTVLAVPTGFYLDWLRYFGFVHLYKFGTASFFDYRGIRSLRYIEERSIRYEGRIDEFWGFQRAEDGAWEASLVDPSCLERQPIPLARKASA